MAEIEIIHVGTPQEQFTPHLFVTLQTDMQAQLQAHGWRYVASGNNPTTPDYVHLVTGYLRGQPVIRQLTGKQVRELIGLLDQLKQTSNAARVAQYGVRRLLEGE